MLSRSVYKILFKKFSKKRQPHFAILLSGSGVYDGSEITESVACLMAISRHNGTYQCFSLNEDQYHVVNHLNGETLNQK